MAQLPQGAEAPDPDQGEPLVHRTQRLLAERGIDDIRVVCQQEAAADITEHATYEPPELVERAWAQEQESSRRRSVLSPR